MEVDKELDVTGMNCPMPLLKAKKAINEMNGGQIVKVLATDPGSVRDFQVFAKQSGHQLLDSGVDDEIFFYYLQKKN